MSVSPVGAPSGQRIGRVFLLLAALSPAMLSGATCSVPSAGHPTIGAAVRDAACTTIQLAAGSYPENVVVNRDLGFEGAGSGLSIVAGAVEAAGAASDVTLARLAVDGTAAGVAGCWPSLLVTTGGARLSVDDDVAVTNSGLASGLCRLFADGFESGNLLAWSSAAP